LILKLIDEAVKQGARQARACQVLELSERTVQRWRTDEDGEDKRKGPQTHPQALSKQEKEALIKIATSLEYSDLAPAQIVARLADKGIYLASESTLYRVLHQNQMQNHRGPTKAPKARSKPNHKANGVGQLWCWDITYLPARIKGKFYYLYLMEDVYTRKIVGWCVQDVESRKLSSQLLENTVKREGVERSGLVLHSDNRAVMKGATMLATMQRLGVSSSFSRPAVSNDNAYCESVFKTLKYRGWYPRQGFESLEEARKWVDGFVRWYNEEHRHSAIGYVTPNQRHEGQDVELLENRRKLYQEAKEKHPQRWKGRQTRGWERPAVVSLTPCSDKSA